MKAALLAACPEARLVDISHEVPVFDVRGGGFVLWAGSRDFPAGSVHLAVVDPGVGGSRRAIAIEAGGSYFVGPDNGLFWLVVQRGSHVRAFSLRRPASASPTFEGRDVFAPVAGALAAGRPIEELGSPIEDLVVLPDSFGPVVLWIDGFGNLVTSLEGPVAALRINGRRITATARTFSEAPPGEPFWYVGSLGFIEVGVREGRADRDLDARAGTRISVLHRA
jgi:hypothetical protein